MPVPFSAPFTKNVDVIVFHLPTNSFAAFMTASAVKPKCFRRSLRGADAPKGCMPMQRPLSPTCCSQPSVAADRKSGGHRGGENARR